MIQVPVPHRRRHIPHTSHTPTSLMMSAALWKRCISVQWKELTSAFRMTRHRSLAALRFERRVCLCVFRGDALVAGSRRGV